MPQIFKPSANTLAKLALFGIIFTVATLFTIASFIQRSPYVTNQKVIRDQPVMFSHEHHVGGLGIDCRYCHTSVEKSSFAGIPPTQTCMTCHSQIWKDAPILEPVRESYRTGQPVEWVRVHDLPDFVYFDHSIHIAKGVGCVTCHGPINKMNMTWQNASLEMQWCLGCHRHPEKYLRPKEEVFNLLWTLPPGQNQEELGRQLMKQYNVKRYTNCSTCHR